MAAKDLGVLNFIISSIRWITAASGALTVILVIIAARVEPKDSNFAN